MTDGDTNQSQPNGFTLHAADTMIIARRTVIDIIDDGLFLYRQDFALFLNAVLLVYIPYYVFKYIAFLLGLLPFQRIFDSFDFFYTGSYTLTNIIFMGLDYTIMILTAGLISCLIHEKAGKRDVRLFDIIRAWMPRLPRLTGLTWMIMAMTAIGFSCFFPGIILYFLFFLSTPVLMIEGGLNLSVLFRRCRYLMQGNWIRTAGFILLTGLLLTLLGLAVTYLVYGMYAILLEQISWLSGLMPDMDMLKLFGSALVTLALFPIESIFITLLYFDIRSRKEGFDLEFLVSRL